ncbi:MAG TPA: DUF6526 family protein [Candidatus Dormibacteraeota bacterium]|nr:DUF6526 family protein [Candidatus Dormibacteraeota bacterium]
MEQQQNFKNHAKVVPAYLFFALPVLALNLGWSLNRWRMDQFSFDGAVAVLTAAALLVALVLSRNYAVRVQDRVIRLEEQLRYARVLPADLQSRAAQLSLGQVLALRFASDQELPGLLKRVLEESLTDRKAIKGLVTNWRADHLRV